MYVGIVGSEAAKFTHETEQLARQLIRLNLSPGDVVVSEGCHLGGIDIWAVEEAKALGLPAPIEYLPKALTWDGGYKQRNIQIAQRAEKVLCFTVKTFPANYTGMRFPYCYHCHTDKHIKSGGCWTVKYAKSIGKPGEVIVVEKL